MILARAPLRISFIGGGTDLPQFYKDYPGRVISITIDKFVYITINPSSYHLDDFILKYRETEVVRHPREIQHPRFRAALISSGIKKGGLEISSLADLPAGTGLGSSSSFLSALLKGLHAFNGKKSSKEDIAKEACLIEIEHLKEPIGKQDQYAAAYGGFNVMEFRQDGTVEVTPVDLPAKDLQDFNDHLLLFYIGTIRDAGSVLSDQQSKIRDNFQTYKDMSDSVLSFKKHIEKKNFEAAAKMLHEGWMRKKSLSGKISNEFIDALYDEARKKGAWGGKILGAGGGGCFLVMAPKEKHKGIVAALSKEAAKRKLKDFRKVDFGFTNSGAEVLFQTNEKMNADRKGK